MAITTYTELKSAVADWLLRDDLTAVIPSFIALAEADMNRKLRHWRMETETTLTATTQYTTLPTDILEPIRAIVAGTNTYKLELAGRGDMQSLRANSNDAGGIPKYYAITKGKLELFPTPSTSTDVDLLYMAKPAALSGSNANNWVLTHHPDIYLYGSLLHAAPYLADDARAQTWATLYNAAIDLANQQSKMAQIGSVSLRIKIRSY